MRWHADSEFNNPNITEILEPGLLEVYPNKEHVGFIERSIREIKERARATCQNLPYQRLTKLMAKELIFGIVTALNTFANENDYNLIQEDDTFNFLDLDKFAPGQPLTIEVVHADGSKDTIKVNHTYNQSQIDWYNEGSALNLIKKQNA